MQEYTLTADGRLLWRDIYFELVLEEERPNWGITDNSADGAMETLQRKIRWKNQQGWLTV